ncbi:multidrug effflux MFS transporter [Bartonella ancashensis]|uniref:multidrug effflux MFS transporter n=1 Tax=Bartonella ancashensis TaxID=1318743 RepID=UPI0039E52AF1
MSYLIEEQKHIDLIKRAIGYKEFIVIIAALMAINSIAIDIMLPATKDILTDFHVANENDQHYIISCYLISFGITQIFFGPISDRYGRRSLVLIGLALYSFASIACALTSNFHVLLLLRLLQGVGGAVMRVLTTAMVRDLYDGKKMAKVMSMVMMIFLIVAMLGPTVGQIILFFGNWKLIFMIMGITSLGLMIWVYLRLPETLYAQTSLSFSSVKKNLWSVISDRNALCYTLATSIVMGCIFASINTSQQVYDGIYNLGVWFPVAFATATIFQVIAAFFNSRLVMTLGIRFIAHSMLLLFSSVSCVWFVSSLLTDGVVPFYYYMMLYSFIMFTCGGIIANFNTLALESLGKIAGTASSVSGCLQTSIATVLGFLVAQQFDDTTIPNSAGFFFLSFIAILLILWAERGCLFMQNASQK